MNSGFHDHFTRHAFASIDELDGLLDVAYGAVPDVEAVVRHARSLRDHATLAQAWGIADVASALELVAGALHNGTVRWSESLRSAIAHAISELRTLARSVPSWSDVESRRATSAARALSDILATTGGTPRAPSGGALAAMLASGLATLGALEHAPLAEPAAVTHDVIVPIEDLLYRGRDALDRARELREQIQQSSSAPDPAVFSELLDLLELAATSD